MNGLLSAGLIQENPVSSKDVAPCPYLPVRDAIRGLGGRCAARYAGGMAERRPYPSDLSDARWALVEPVLNAWRATTKPYRPAPKP